MGDRTQTANPNEPIDLTLGELRRLRARTAWTQGDMDYEAKNLRYALTRVQERVKSLEDDSAKCAFLLARIDATIAEAEKLPRGRRLVLTSPWAYPKYNPHRRLAIMERSYL